MVKGSQGKKAGAGKAPKPAGGGRGGGGGSRSGGDNSGARPGPDAAFYRTMDAIVGDMEMPESSAPPHRFGDLLLLDGFSKAHGMPSKDVEAAVRRSGAFALEEVTVKEGTIITKEVSRLAIVRAPEGALVNSPGSHPAHSAAAASLSDGLLRERRRSLEEELAAAFKGGVRFEAPGQYHPVLPDRAAILAAAGISEDDDVRDAKKPAAGRTPHGIGGAAVESDGSDTSANLTRSAGNGGGHGPGSAITDPVHLMHHRVSGRAGAKFPDGTSPRDLETWMRSLAMASTADVGKMLMDGSLEGWLDEGELRVLGSAVASVRRRVEASGGEPGPDVKRHLFLRLRETGMGSVMYSMGAAPLLDRVTGGKVADPSALVEAITSLGGRLAVEPLVSALFTSDPGVRRAIIDGLGDLGDRRATPALVKILDFSRDEGDRIAALGALHRMDDARARDAVERAAKAGGKVGKKATEMSGH